MKASASWARSACGVDDDQGRLIVVQATRRRGSLSFGKVQPADLSKGAVAACIFQRESFMKWVTAPLSSARKAERVFRALLDVQLPFSVEDCEIALVETRPTADRSGTRGLVTGARNGAIEKRLAGLQAAGVTPHVLDQESLALWSQGVGEFPAATGDRTVRVLTYLGADRTTLVVGQGDELLGAHSLRQTDPDQMIRLLKSYFSSRPVATQWIWVGPLASAFEAVQKLYSNLSARWPGSTMKVAHDPETFLARALAARALSSGPCRCNLRAGAFLHPLLQKQQARAPCKLAVAVLVAGLALIAVNLAWQASVHRKLTRIQDRIHSLAVEIAGSPRLVPHGQEVLSARRALETQSLHFEPFLVAAGAPLTDALKAILSIGQEEALSIETLALNRKTVVFHGLATKWSQCEKAAGRLKALGADVKAERKDAPAGEERIAFVISMGFARER